MTQKLPPPSPPSAKKITFGKIATSTGHRILLYGPGGIGKTTLAASAPGDVAFFDLDESLPRLRLENTPNIVEVSTWSELRNALSLEWPANIKTLVIDSATKAEELAVAHTLTTTK